MSLLAAAIFGVLIGISLGALGGGGSILTVPALVYALGESAKAATTGSLVIVGVTSLVGSLGHARAGRVRSRAGAAFGAVGIASSYLGTALNRRLDPNTLLLVFAGLMLVAAAAMYARSRRPASPTEPVPSVATPALVAAGGFTIPPATPPIRRPGRDGPRPASAERPAAGDRMGAPIVEEPRTSLTVRTGVKVVVAGLIVGFLTGLLGVGGGFIIVPALVLALRYTMPVAVGTSLLVISINSAAALLARVGHEQFHWAVIIPFTAAAILGSLAGKRIADRVPGTSLTRAFAGLLVLVAGYVAVRAGTAIG